MPVTLNGPGERVGSVWFSNVSCGTMLIMADVQLTAFCYVPTKKQAPHLAIEGV